MSAYSQENRQIQISVTLKNDSMMKLPFGLGEKLMLDSFYGQEGVSIPFHFDLVLCSTDPALKFSDVVGQPATIKMICPAGKIRYINGILSSFTQLGQKMDLTTYQATLAPELWILTRNYDCRIFQNTDARKIVLKLLKENGVKFVDDLLTASLYKTREFCVQYNETDFDFISRLMEEEGIFYFFKHEMGKHTVVLAEKPGFFADNPLLKTDDKSGPSVLYGQSTTDAPLANFVSSWNVGQEVQPQSWTQRDYNFKQPSLDLTTTSQTGQNPALDVYEYPGLYEDKTRGLQLTDVKMEQVETAQTVVSAASNYPSMQPGFVFKLTGHFRTDFNSTYVPTSIYHIARQGGNFHSSSKDGECDFVYNNTFTAIPSTSKFRPPQTIALPNISSTQTALVIGRKEAPENEEIYADQYGRVKVRFFWDRRKQNQPQLDDDDPIAPCPGDCSCWIRVMHPWAGSGWGHQWIPRIGQEVVVTFLEGNPDRPLITGAVYNGENALPFVKGDQVLTSQSGIKTRSTPKGTAENCNIIRFEDKKGSEDLLIHAEATMHESVEASQFVSVGANQTITVGGDRHITTGGVDKNGNKVGDVKELIFKNHNLHVKTDDRIKIEGESHLHVMKKADATYDADWVQNVTGKCVILADTIQLQGKTKIVLMAGSSSIVIDAKGVTVLGAPLINLNTPGAPAVPEIAPPPVDPDDP